MTDYEAVLEIMEAESTITSKVAKLKDNDGTSTAYTAIVYGDLPEAQNVYPAISLRSGSDITNGNVQISFITANCWSETMKESKDLAKAIDDKFTDTLLSATDFSFWSASDIIDTISDGEYYNTPVNIKITHIRR